MAEPLEIELDYKNWLKVIFSQYTCQHGAFERLFDLLYSTEFVPLMEMDTNRCEDGKDIRLRFADSTTNYNYRDIYMYLYNKPCNMLELMLGLAFRIEELTMTDFVTDRTGVWFDEMMTNSGLYLQDDYSFNTEEAYGIVDRIITRTYDYNGTGGLFSIQKTNEDMRQIDIWSQANRYLDEYLGV